MVLIVFSVLNSMLMVQHLLSTPYVPSTFSVHEFITIILKSEDIISSPLPSGEGAEALLQPPRGTVPPAPPPWGQVRVNAHLGVKNKWEGVSSLSGILCSRCSLWSPDFL